MPTAVGIRCQWRSLSNLCLHTYTLTRHATGTIVSLASYISYVKTKSFQILANVLGNCLPCYSGEMRELQKFFSNVTIGILKSHTQRHNLSIERRNFINQNSKEFCLLDVIYQALLDYLAYNVKQFVLCVR